MAREVFRRTYSDLRPGDKYLFKIASRIWSLVFLLSLCWAGVAGAATIDLYLSPPGEQNTTVPGATVETFNALPTGSIGTAGNWAIGSYVNNPTTGRLDAADGNGGAGGVGNYLRVFGGPIVVTLPANQHYVGFWWSAGDPSNQIDFYDTNNNLVASFTTASLFALLGGAGNVTASDGTLYAKSAYFGNPNPPPGQAAGEPFGYVNLISNGPTTFGKIVLRGANFEVDNIALAPAAVPSLPWVPFGSVVIVDPGGAVSVPTLSEWSLIVLATLLGGVALVLTRRKQQSAQVHGRPLRR